MHLVRKINYIDGYKISLTFDDRETKIVDIEPYLNKGIFLTLRDRDYFNMVKVKDDTIVWPNEADFCPDVLYEIGVPVASKPLHRKRKSSKPPIAQP